jgi:PKD repeat protein
MKQLNFYTLFLLLLFFSHSTVAQHLSASNYNLHRAPAFLENKGQVVDQNDHLRKDVRFIYDNQKGLKLILKDHSFSYEVYSYEKQPKKNISEATGQPIEGQLPDKFKEPDPVTVKINRIDIDLKGSNAHPEIISEGRSADYVNYYKEYAGENGVTDIHYYSKVTYRNIYRNIDFVFLAQADGSFKYNIVVHPGGRLSDVTMIYSGMKELSTFGNKLETKTALGGVEETIPFSYIKETGEKMLVQYACKGGLITLFAEEENKGTLVIDPVVREWGTYFGGSNDDNGWGLAVDSSGNILVSGQTFSSSGIVSSGSYQTFIGGGLDAFLVKFSNSGSRLWATYFGEMGDEAGRGVVADALGNAYMAGYTSSTSGIATTGSYQTSNAGGKDAFVVKFNSSGILNWATYYGGSNDDLAYGIALDTSANIYIAGYTSSASGIASSAAFQKSYSGGKDAFLAKFDSSGSRSWGTYYGGTNDDLGEAVATDKEGDVYLTGYTSSLGLYSSGAFQTSFGGGGEDAFLAKFSSSGSRVWGTLYGGSGYDYGYSLAMDTSGNVYLAGQTGSTSGIATTGASQTSRNGNADAFIVKFSSTGSRSWGTYFGGNSYDWGYGIATDRTGNIYLTGYTFSSSGIATPRAYQTSLKGTGNGYCVKFNSFGSKRWATYYGDGYEAVYAIAIDQMSNVYITGNTKSLNGIASPGAFQTKEGGSLDCFLVEFSDVMLDAGVISVDSLASSYCGETTKDVYARIKNFSTNKINTFYVGWSVNGSLQVAIKDSSGLIAGDTSPVIKLGTYKFSGGSDTLKVWTYNPNDSTDRNHWNDTFQQIAVISALPSVVFNAANTCMGSAVPLKNQSSILTGAISSFIWDFGDGTTSTLKTPVKVYLQPGHYTIRLVAIATAGCSDSVKKTITVYPLPQADFNAGNFCTGESIGLINNSKSDPTFPKVSYHWDFGDSTTSQDSLPVKIYQNAGIYNIRLVVTDSAACSDTAVRRIIINTAPKIAFNVENTCAGESLVLNLTKDSAGKHIFFWNFGDGITSADSLPVHIFSSSGTYTIRLTATTDHRLGFDPGIRHR